jgi:peptidoglycan/LPS O-acetylase OafA/YrhL
MVFAELHLRRQSLRQEKRRKWRSIGSAFCRPLVFILGAWMSSISHTHGSYGSSSLGYHTVSKVVPWHSNIYYMGAALLTPAVNNMPFVQSIFATQFFRYLGNIPFGLYLMHWPVLAAGYWQIVPLMWHLTGNETILRYGAGICLALSLVTLIVFWAADV